MATVARLKLGPRDHGRFVSFDEFQAADYKLGYHYELIDGRLYVSPVPNLPEDCLEEWLSNGLREYAARHPEVINFVTNKARIFVPGGRRTTAPEPDLAAYRDFPVHLPLRERRWQDVSPILVVEIPTASDPNKDLIRNVRLYRRVPSIREYWIVDGREDPDRPLFRVYRRRARGWGIRNARFGRTYTTKVLPDFKLIVDPHK
jgi:Uma2 family endonuclease